MFLLFCNTQTLKHTNNKRNTYSTAHLQNKCKEMYQCVFAVCVLRLWWRRARRWTATWKSARDARLASSLPTFCRRSEEPQQAACQPSVQFPSQVSPPAVTHTLLLIQQLILEVLYQHMLAFSCVLLVCTSKYITKYIKAFLPKTVLAQRFTKTKMQISSVLLWTDTRVCTSRLHWFYYLAHFLALMYLIWVLC